MLMTVIVRVMRRALMVIMLMAMVRQQHWQ